MTAYMLANGNIVIPMRAEGPRGLIGDGLGLIGPDHPRFEVWKAEALPATAKIEGWFGSRVPWPWRPSEYALEQPDAPGRWWFVGRCRWLAPEGRIGDYLIKIEIALPRPFQIIAEDDQFVASDPETGEVYRDVEWKGWWVRLDEPESAGLN